MNEFCCCTSNENYAQLLTSILLYPSLDINRNATPEEIYNQMYENILNANIEKERQRILNTLIEQKEQIINNLQNMWSDTNAQS